MNEFLLIPLLQIEAPPKKIISPDSFLDHKESGFIHFVKYHGLGNDFILVDNRNSTEPKVTEQAIRLCDRNFGIGADGVIFAMPGINGSDYTMRIFNSDGSEPEGYEESVMSEKKEEKRMVEHLQAFISQRGRGRGRGRSQYSSQGRGFAPAGRSNSSNDGFQQQQDCVRDNRGGQQDRGHDNRSGNWQQRQPRTGGREWQSSGRQQTTNGIHVCCIKGSYNTRPGSLEMVTSMLKFGSSY